MSRSSQGDVAGGLFGTGLFGTVLAGGLIIGLILIAGSDSDDEKQERSARHHAMVEQCESLGGFAFVDRDGWFIQCVVQPWP